MVDLATLTIDASVLRLLPAETALELAVLPYATTRDSVIIAVPENSDSELVANLQFLVGKRIEPMPATRNAILEAVVRCYGISPLAARRSNIGHPLPCRDFQPERLAPPSPGVSRAGTWDLASQDAGASMDFDGGVRVDNGSVVTLVNRLLTDAVAMGASDIHVEPYEQRLRVRFRLDGVLHEVAHPPAEQARALVSRLKIMADLDIAEKRKPQDGRIRMRLDTRTVDVRVSTLPTDFGEKVVLRILDKSQLQLDLTQLGFENDDLALFRRTIQLPYGMILVTGPTGCGKTTTLYAALHAINYPTLNITTIEDPVEYNLSGINQTHVRPDIGLTFAAALRSILRQDPNVIMVGEVRDTETAEIAIRAALTGHLVFSTLHTNDAPSAITRLVDMGLEPFLIASSVRLIVAQRLLRKLCNRCKRPHLPDNNMIDRLGLNRTQRAADYFSPVGCAECHNIGHKGRTAVFELLDVRDELSDIVANGSSASELRHRAQRDGFVSLRGAALRKAERGETSLEEVMRETAA